MIPGSPRDFARAQVELLVLTGTPVSVRERDRLAARCEEDEAWLERLDGCRRVRESREERIREDRRIMAASGRRLLRALDNSR